MNLLPKRAATTTAWLARAAAAFAGAAAIALAAMAGAAQPAAAAAGGSSISAGQELHAGQDLVSPGGQYTLDMQGDGNLVAYGNGCVIWDSGTAGTGSSNYLAMQGDGNLVVYTSAGKAVWNSGTAGTGSANFLNMQVDGNVVVYTSADRPVWSSGASSADQLCAPATMSAGMYLHSPSGQYHLNMQGDGNLVVYDNGSATWSSGTAGTGAANYLAMQDDGNMVVYTSAGKAVWNSGTAGTGGGSHLVMQNDGNLVVYAGNGKAVWSSGTAGVGIGPSGPWPGTAGPAAAAKYYGYPYPNAPQCTAGADKCVDDKWLFYRGQCTSWAAYRLNQLNGIAFSNSYRGQHWGPATHWGTAAGNLGIAVNRTPALGSIAWYSSGHVAYVEQVKSPTSVVISEMNYDYANGFRLRTITTTSGWPTDFLHIADR